MTWWLAHNLSIKSESKSNLHNVQFCSGRATNNGWILFNRNNPIQVSTYDAIKDWVDFLAIHRKHPLCFQWLSPSMVWIPVHMTVPSTTVWLYTAFIYIHSHHTWFFTWDLAWFSSEKTNALKNSLAIQTILSLISLV